MTLSKRADQLTTAAPDVARQFGIHDPLLLLLILRFADAIHQDQHDDEPFWHHLSRTPSAIKAIFTGSRAGLWLDDVKDGITGDEQLLRAVRLMVVEAAAFIEQRV